MVDALFDNAGENAVVLRVHVQPGAGRTAVVGRHGDALKVRVAAPPEGGRANEACAELIVSTFGVKAEQVELKSGQSSRAKRFAVTGIDPVDFERLLDEALATATNASGQAATNRNSSRH